MKRAFFAVLLALLIPLAGCEPPTAAPSNAPDYAASALPEVIAPQGELDFGDVTMLLYGYKTTLDDKDTRRQRRILAAVADAIREQTGVRMALHALPVMNPLEKLKELAAAGTPPEISTWLPKSPGDASEAERLSGTALKPLALDDALLRYGQHLRAAIPEADWQDVTVNDHIAAIPMLNPSSMVAVLNQSALDKYDWEIPKTVEALEQLLAKAGEQGLTPVLSAPYLGVSPAWYGLANVSAVEEGGKLAPAMGSQRRLQWLRQQRAWIDSKWMSAVPAQDAVESIVAKGTWLCREMQLPAVGNTPGIAVLPPLSAGGSTPGCLPMLTAGSLFESYARPDAMVFLLDWVYADAANNFLISQGQKDIDYRQNGDGSVKLLDGLPWMGSMQFNILPVFDLPFAAWHNQQAYDQAQEYARQSGGAANTRDGIPVMAWENRKRGSRLDTAGRKKDEYELKTSESETQVLQGIKTLEAHEAALMEYAPLMDEYLQLIQDIREGKYDVWQDVQPLS